MLLPEDKKRESQFERYKSQVKTGRQAAGEDGDQTANAAKEKKQRHNPKRRPVPVDPGNHPKQDDADAQP